MSNQFPKHPLAAGNYLTLAVHSEVIAKDLVLAPNVPQMVLIVPPPPAATGNEPAFVRLIRNKDDGGCVCVNNTGLVNPIDDLRLFIRIGGIDYEMNSNVIAADDASVLGSLNGAMALIASDDGIYVRMTSVLGTTVQLVSSYVEVRNLTVKDIELEQGVKKGLLSNESENTNPFVDISVPVGFLNADPAVTQSLGLAFNDGADEVLFQRVSAFQGVYQAQVLPFLLAVPKGGALSATLTPSAATQPMFARVVYAETNSGPARPNQGGAY